MQQSTISKEEISRGVLQSQVALVLLTCNVLPLSIANVMKHICMEVQQLHAVSCKLPTSLKDAHAQDPKNKQAEQLEAIM